MQISSVLQNNVNVIGIAGNFDATTAPEASRFFKDEIENGKYEVVIDLSGVTYISSAGVRAILSAMQDTRNAGGDTRLAGATGNIKRVIETAGFNKIMKTFKSVGEAVASYSPS